MGESGFAEPLLPQGADVVDKNFRVSWLRAKFQRELPVDTEPGSSSDCYLEETLDACLPSWRAQRDAELCGRAAAAPGGRAPEGQSDVHSNERQPGETKDSKQQWWQLVSKRQRWLIVVSKANLQSLLDMDDDALQAIVRDNQACMEGITVADLKALQKWEATEAKHRATVEYIRERVPPLASCFTMGEHELPRPEPRSREENWTELVSPEELSRVLRKASAVSRQFAVSLVRGRLSERRLREVRRWEEDRKDEARQWRSQVCRRHVRVLCGYICYFLMAFHLAAGVTPEDREQVAAAWDVVLFCLGSFILWFIRLEPEVAHVLGKRLLDTIDSPVYWLEGYFYADWGLWEDNVTGWKYKRFPSIWGTLFAISRRTGLSYSYFLWWIIMLPVALFAVIHSHFGEWMGHFNAIAQLSVHDAQFSTMLKRYENDTSPSLGSLMSDPYQCCEYFHSVPEPYYFMALKAVIVSFVVDWLFGFPDLSKAGVRKGPISNLGRVLTAINITQVWLAYGHGWLRAKAGDFGEGAWYPYLFYMYFVVSKTAIDSLTLNAWKLYWEIGAQDGTGAPASLVRWDRWQAPGPGGRRPFKNMFILLWRCIKCILGLGFELPETHSQEYDERTCWFYAAFLTLEVTFFPLFFTHTFPMMLLMALALGTPLLGPLLFVGWGVNRYLFSLGRCWTDASWLIVSCFSNLWQDVAIVWFTTVGVVTLRKLFWEIHTRYRLWQFRLDVRNKYQGNTRWPRRVPDEVFDNEAAKPRKKGEPHGPYGFNLPCYTVLFTVPFLALGNAFNSTATAHYLGSKNIGEALTKDIEMRQIFPFMQCMVNQEVSLLWRTLQWMGLI